MTDSCSGFTKDQFLACLKQYGPELSAHEVAHLCKVSIKQVLCVQHHHPWDIVPITGDWPSWKYARRTTLSATAKAKREIANFNDQGISPITGNPKGYYA